MDRHPRSSTVALVAATLFALGGAGVVTARHLQERVTHIDSVAGESARAYRDFRSSLEEVREDLVLLRRDLESTRNLDEETRALLQERLASTESRLGNIGSVVEANSSGLAELARTQATFGPELEAREERLQKRWENLRELAASASQLADESQRRVAEIAAPRDLRRMWRELVGPVVQVAGDTSVGSGVLLPSRPDAKGKGFETYLLTAWHVIRDIQAEPGRRDEPVGISIYHEDGGVRLETAELLAFDAELDAALLIVRSTDDLAHGAALATPQRLARVQTFDEVYAVGCPLGNDPIPTRGEIATRHHDVDGSTYWMINAPTYIGNSGGGIFDGRTHELLGLFSKIYTHGSLRPTIVPHMGLVTPLSAVYGWLEEEGYGHIVPQERATELAAGEREALGPPSATPR